MRVVVQRVCRGDVRCEQKSACTIEKGVVLLVGFHRTDTRADVAWLAKKIVSLRIFEDAQGKMNLSLQDICGEILAVPNFTLVANTRKGNRPNFDTGLVPQEAEKLFEQFVMLLRETGLTLQAGYFGRHMVVSIHNDGPVTFVIDSTVTSDL